MGLVVIIVGVLYTNCPLLAIYPFSVQNQKKVVGLIEQVLVTFKEGY
jgi:hypothetical protein